MASQLDQRSEECNRLVFEAVNEISLSKLKLANGTYTPSQLLTSLAQCNVKGETPLIAAMRKKNISIIEEMVTWMLDYKNHLFHKKECKPMPIFIIEQFFHDICVLPSDFGTFWFHEDFIEDGKSWLELIGSVFLQSTSLTRQDKIIALELIGALAIIHCCDSMPQHALMPLKYWREAMLLRHFPQDGEPLLPKVPAIYVPTQASSDIFGSTPEIMTMEELKLLEEDFERYSSFNSDLTLLFKDRLLIQALLVMRRIFIQSKLRYPHWLYLGSFWIYAAFLNRREKKIAVKNFSTYIFIFEQLNGYDPKLLSRRSFNVFIEAISSTVSTFFSIYNDHPVQEEEPESENPARVKLVFDILLAVTKFIATISDFFPNPAMMLAEDFDCKFEKMVYRLLSPMVDISSQITDQEKHQLEETFSYLIRNFFPERTTTVLHLAAFEAFFLHWDLHDWYRYLDESKKILKLKKTHTRIKLILQLGADVNAIDEVGRTPLHILADTRYNPWKEYVNIFQTLVDAGSHLYLADNYGTTVISSLRGFVRRNQNDDEIPSHHYFESLVIDVFPLTCLCARVIRRHKIPFLKHQLPLTLHKLVSP